MPQFRIIILILVVFFVFLFGTGIVSPIELFDIVLLQPILNLLILLSKVFFGSFGLAIIALTIIIKVVTLPLTIKQQRSVKAMQEIQPKMKELQKKHGKDQQQLAKEMQKLYKEHGVSPLGCMLPMVSQIPIWIGLYQSIIQCLAFAPENLVGLAKQLYPWAIIQEQVPLNNHFLGLDLVHPNIILAVLVAVSMWMMQRMTVTQTADPQQQSMTRMMIWFMPVMFGFMAMSFPSGLSLYWVLNSLISMVIQYRISGWGNLSVPSLGGMLGGGPSKPREAPVKVDSGPEGDVVAEQDGDIEGSAADGIWGAAADDVSTRRRKVSHGKQRGKRKIRRRSR